jgi:elongation factor P
MIYINEMKNGMSIIVDDQLYTVLEFQHVKPGKGPAFVKTKLKNLRTGATIEKTFNSNIKVERVLVDKREMQFLYATGDVYTFMDNETYEQMELTANQLGDDKYYLKDGINLTITVYNSEVLGVILPEKVELIVTDTEPAVKGNTTNNAQKEAIVETGLSVKVPLFIEKDEVIVISTRDGSYVSRA